MADVVACLRKLRQIANVAVSPKPERNAPQCCHSGNEIPEALTPKPEIAACCLRRPPTRYLTIPGRPLNRGRLGGKAVDVGLARRGGLFPFERAGGAARKPRRVCGPAGSEVCSPRRITLSYRIATSPGSAVRSSRRRRSRTTFGRSRHVRVRPASSKDAGESGQAPRADARADAGDAGSNRG
jgi:hypothetical protein